MQSKNDTGAQGTENSRQPLFPLGDELSIDEIMERVRTELAQSDSAGDDDESVDSSATARVLSEHAPRWSASGPRLPVQQSYKLRDLLQFADREFVANAYRVFLRRLPDEQGMSHYIDALRNGFLSKIEILGEIRFSPEGMRHSVHVDGLLIPYKLHGWRRLPVIGRLVSAMMMLLRLPQLAMHLQALESASGRATQELGHVVNEVGKWAENRLELVGSDIAAQAERVRLHVEDLHAKTEVWVQQTEDLRLRVEALEGNAKLHMDDVPSDEFKQAMAKIKADMDAASARSLENRRGIIDVQRKLLEVFDRVQAGRAEPREPASSEPIDSGAGSPVLHADYVSFEDTFRGERDDIKRRAAHYLDSLKDAGIMPGGGTIVDLGCGRGEWLELLAENGYHARGVDLNPVMLEDSRGHGLDVVEADALTFLRSLEDASLAAITSMHLVEHLPHHVMIQLLDEVWRVLKPGGLMALETPNPENITVGSCWFYLDPTHRNPIPPALLQWQVANRGFVEIAVERLSEHRGTAAIEPLDGDIPGAAQVNQMITWFTASPDYAVLARKR